MHGKATKNQIKQWIEKGIETNATHVIIALDTWDYENYPVYINNSEHLVEVLKRYNKSEDRIDEIYNLSMDIEEQLKQDRARNI